MIVAVKKDNRTRGLFSDQVQSDWACPSEFPDDLPDVVALDLETRDKTFDTLGPGYCFKDGGYIVGVGLADAKRQWYFPIRHADGGNLDPDMVLSFIRDVCKHHIVVCHNALYDVGWLRTEGIEVPDVHDTQYMAALLDENRYSYSLDAVGWDYVRAKKDERQLKEAAAAYSVDPKNGMWMMAAKHVGKYGEQDARITYDLYEHFQPIMERKRLGKIYELEQSLINPLVDMRMAGIRYDAHAAMVARKEMMAAEADALKRIKKLTGCQARPGVPSADAAVILEKAGYDLPRTAKGNPSVTSGWLAMASKNNELPEAILTARQMLKARRDFIEGTIKKAQGDRIHANFHPLRSDEGGTVSGRFSCSNPNLQQQPARNPKIKKAIRGMFLPDEGDLWTSLDYSSQEPRFTLHYAGVIKAPGASKAIRRFRENPRTDYHGMVQEFADITDSTVPGKKGRFIAKQINLGLAYGMKGAGLCKILGLPTEFVDLPDRKNPDRLRPVEVAGEEGKAILAQYHEGIPYLDRLNKRVERMAKDRGFIRTYGGRLCHFFEGMGTHKALNRLIQGSAADQLKIAMRELFAAGFKIRALVHDETCISVANKKEAEHAAALMEGCCPDMLVPSVVDVNLGKNWGEAK